MNRDFTQEIEYVPEDESSEKNALFIDCPCCNAGLAVEFALISKHVDSTRAFENYKRVFVNRYKINGLEPIKEEEVKPLAQAGIGFLVGCKLLGDLKQKRK